MNLAVNGTKDFSYTGSVTCAYLQKAGYYKLEVWGAQGETGYYNNKTSTTEGDNKQVHPGGYGGYSFGKIYSNAGSALYIVVSLHPSTYAGGYNGGGTSGLISNASYRSGAGGGATHISVQNCGELKNCSSYKGTYDSSKGTYDGGKILIVAGGGGGGSHNNSSNYRSYFGGVGGGYTGATGGTASCGSGTASGGGGGTQSTGGGIGTAMGSGWYSPSTEGTFGLGGFGGVESGFQANLDHYSGGGGGGGWYGGGGGGSCTRSSGASSGGGGGSGYIGNSLLLADKGMYMYSTGCTSSTTAATKTTCTSSYGAHTANAANTGNGYARITYLGT